MLRGVARSHAGVGGFIPPQPIVCSRVEAVKEGALGGTLSSPEPDTVTLGSTEITFRREQP